MPPVSDTGSGMRTPLHYYPVLPHHTLEIAGLERNRKCIRFLVPSGYGFATAELWQCAAVAFQGDSAKREDAAIHREHKQIGLPDAILKYITTSHGTYS